MAESESRQLQCRSLESEVEQESSAVLGAGGGSAGAAAGCDVGAVLDAVCPGPADAAGAVLAAAGWDAAAAVATPPPGPAAGARLGGPGAVGLAAAAAAAAPCVGAGPPADAAVDASGPDQHLAGGPDDGRAGPAVAVQAPLPPLLLPPLQQMQKALCLPCPRHQHPQASGTAPAAEPTQGRLHATSHQCALSGPAHASLQAWPPAGATYKRKAIKLLPSEEGQTCQKSEAEL
eukprot:scaffold2990_cov18-Tisochrysis_lutea.AAC.1